MGRGRAKAKQTKVARQLKYYSPDTDYNALQRELGGSESHPDSSQRTAVPEKDETPEDDYSSKYDDESRWASGDR